MLLQFLVASAAACLGFITSSILSANKISRAHAQLAELRRNSGLRSDCVQISGSDRAESPQIQMQIRAE